MPLIPIAGMLSRKLWDSLGGMDVRFIGQFWDFDIDMRHYQNKGQTVVCPGATVCDKYLYRYEKHRIKRKKYPRLSKYKQSYDFNFLLSLWCTLSPSAATKKKIEKEDWVLNKERQSAVIP